MSAPWFRVPMWCHSMHDEANAARARAWVYLLGSWHAGDDPSTREVRRVTGFGGTRADTLVETVAAWAVANGAAVPSRLAGQQRGSNGAASGRPEAASTPASEPSRGRSGAASGQERGAHARVPFQEREMEKVEERETQEAPAPAVAPSAPRKPDDAAALHAVYRGHRPRVSATPTPDSRKALSRILAECGDLEAAATYLAWTFESQDTHARQLRGEAPWPGGSVQARCDVVSLSRNVPPRLSAAVAWDARGRRDAPQVVAFAPHAPATKTEGLLRHLHQRFLESTNAD